MQFLVIARDCRDGEALGRRMAARERHMALGAEAAEKGEQIMAAAMIGESGNMCGSVLIVDFPDRQALDAWLKEEPYVTGGVWDEIEIIPCKVAPAFARR